MVSPLVLQFNRDRSSSGHQTKDFVVEFVYSLTHVSRGQKDVGDREEKECRNPKSKDFYK